MKNTFIICILSFLSLQLFAQNNAVKKSPTIGLHFFYNDFKTAQQLKMNSLSFVLNNHLWAKPNNLEGGFGLDYFQGITKKIDLVGTINASWVDYLLPGNVLYGSSNFLMDLNAGAHIKMLDDKKTFNPFLITKIGYSKYKNIGGFTAMPGLGIQINFFDECFVLPTVEYRYAISSPISNQLYYSIGIATNLFKPKTKIIKPAPEPKPAPSIAPVVVEKNISKDIAITVNDEATGQPLPNVLVSLKKDNGDIVNATTNDLGKAVFSNINEGEYSVLGTLHNINTNIENINKNNFSISSNQVQITLTHNDPRFTLSGNAVDIAANKPVGNAQITINNKSLSSTSFATSNKVDGSFNTQLEANSDFEIVGKKENYISNIESISTKGLNRSTTLYVKLKLNIEEAKAGTKIVLNKIYFETGKAAINTSASTDLQKLIQFLKDNPLVKLEIQGHTDNVGSDASNIKLSQARANTVVNYLIKNGIASERLISKGYGPSIPIGDNNTSEGRAKNRRVEMKVMD